MELIKKARREGESIKKTIESTNAKIKAFRFKKFIVDLSFGEYCRELEDGGVDLAAANVYWNDLEGFLKEDYYERLTQE